MAQVGTGRGGCFATLPFGCDGFSFRPARVAPAAVALALLLTSCSGQIARPVAATVLSIDGTCTWRRESAPSRSLDRSSHPANGDSIETAADGVARLAVLPNVLVELTPDTEVQLLDLSLSEDGNETGEAMRSRIARLRLVKGAVQVSQERRDVAAEPSLVIETRHGNAESTYDALMAVTTARERTTVTCASGWVYFKMRNSKEAVQVQPGHVLQLSDAAEPKVFAAETNAASQKTIADATAAAKMLIRLRDSLKDAPPPWKVADGR